MRSRPTRLADCQLLSPTSWYPNAPQRAFGGTGCTPAAQQLRICRGRRKATEAVRGCAMCCRRGALCRAANTEECSGLLPVPPSPEAGLEMQLMIGHSFSARKQGIRRALPAACSASGAAGEAHPAPPVPAGLPRPRPPLSVRGTTRWCPSRRPCPGPAPAQGGGRAQGWSAGSHSAARAACCCLTGGHAWWAERAQPWWQKAGSPRRSHASQPWRVAQPRGPAPPARTPAPPTQFIARTVSSIGVSGSGRWQ